MLMSDESKAQNNTDQKYMRTVATAVPESRAADSTSVDVDQSEKVRKRTKRTIIFRPPREPLPPHEVLENEANKRP